MTGVVTLAGVDATIQLGRDLARVLRAGDLVVLVGGLGAGKTTLTKGIGAGLGVAGTIASPTFIIARAHRGVAGGPDLVHVDAYRIGSLDEIDALDLDSSLAGSVTVVEWGEGWVEQLVDDRLEVRLERPRGGPGGSEDEGGDDGAGDGDGDVRTAVVVGHGDRWAGVVLPGA